MRNWNARNFRQLLGVVLRLYLTYEELKPCIFCTITLGPCSLYLTYEELKPFYYSLRKLARCLVYILPMRNWNTSLKIVLASIFPFISYLWGIETLIPSHIAVAVARLYLTYEELKLGSLLLSRSRPHRLYLTYEELKPSTLHEASPLSHWFISYLWGIETQPSAFPLIICNCLYLTYEELKLIIKKQKFE